jgi:hypothetical protein
MGLEDALILLSLLVDDAYTILIFGRRLRHCGPKPKRSDIEVLTMEIFGKQPGRDSAPHCPCSSSGSWMLSARGDIHLLDGFPIPVCRTCRGNRSQIFRNEVAWDCCAIKKEPFYRLRGYLVIDLAATEVAFTVTVANVDERDVFKEALAEVRGVVTAERSSGDQWRWWWLKGLSQR